ncbi:hypothetical protein RHSIM_Rhsim08G0023200 [Rhododendron simsii]|uniref:Uncharacterized protein n=1 Tax=Rhododendron simsii TaxID=118357 RepID=A0A834LGB0_RHOSS|nr:hypothetical protein RHSIM_Rhsim08G0023200 [Rhododendron simsii]
MLNEHSALEGPSLFLSRATLMRLLLSGTELQRFCWDLLITLLEWICGLWVAYLINNGAVRGIMYYRRALKLQAFLDMASESQLWKLEAERRFNPSLRVAYIDEAEERDNGKVQKVYYSVLVKALDNLDQCIADFDFLSLVDHLKRQALFPGDSEFQQQLHIFRRGKKMGGIEYLVLEGYGYVVLTLVLYCFFNFWMAFQVGKARKK